MPTRILLVEDNPGDVLLLRQKLKFIEGWSYELGTAASLGEGLQKLSEAPWDVVLLDLLLPDSSGFKTLEAFIGSESKVPVIVLTGMSDRTTAVKALQQGAQDFLVKDGLEPEILERSIYHAIDRFRLLQKIKDEEERYFLVAMGSHDGLWDWDLRTDRVHFSANWKKMLGFEETGIGDKLGEWLGRVHPADRERVWKDLSDHLAGKTPHFSNEHRLLGKDDRYRWVLARGQAFLDQKGKATRIAGSFTDITYHKNMEQQLALRAFYDPLTGLPNRPHFVESLKRAMARLDRGPAPPFALFFLDLDRFKAVNDQMGHQAGDQLLIEFSQRLKSCVRPSDLVARIGGDEFTVLLENLDNRREALEVADRILTASQIPFHIEGKQVTAGASIGIAYSDCGKVGVDGLMQAADAAMYRAKALGKGRYEIFTHGGPGGQKGMKHAS